MTSRKESAKAQKPDSSSHMNHPTTPERELLRLIESARRMVLDLEKLHSMYTRIRKTKFIPKDGNPVVPSSGVIPRFFTCQSKDASHTPSSSTTPSDGEMISSASPPMRGRNSTSTTYGCGDSTPINPTPHRETRGPVLPQCRPSTRMGLTSKPRRGAS